MTIYLTADLHLGHSNILKYSSRPFQTILDHDETIIDNINKIVGRTNDLYIIGDFCMGNPAPYLDKIKCQKLHFVIGSHDNQMWKFRTRFLDFKDKIHLWYSGHLIVMTHCPHLIWEKSHFGSINAHGHLHCGKSNSGDPENFGKFFDVIIIMLSNDAREHMFGVLKLMMWLPMLHMMMD